MTRLVLAAILAVTSLLPPAIAPAYAAGNERSLYLYYTHTGETARITFKRNGRYVQDGLRQLNQFLRDWRRNEPATMDPALFDLIWSVYQEVGASEPINIVSAYRSPATNEMLRRSSSGVAENSQHTKGHAMDFFIPGIPLDKLREVAMRHQVGGVGYYPTSGSPFVHLDTGNVRAWPRMTRNQLARVFPDGKTLHLPADGRPLSEEGRQFAQAQWQQCRTVPCGRSESVQVAGGGQRSLMDMLSGGDDAPQVADAGPQARAVQTVAIVAPVPQSRPASLGGGAEPGDMPFSSTGSAPLEEFATASIDASLEAPVPAQKSERIRIATGAPIVIDPSNTAIAAIASLEAPQPAARVLMSDPTLVTAYADMPANDPEAQRALEMIIERETTAAIAPQPAIQSRVLLGANALRTASLGSDGAMDAFAGLFDRTWEAMSGAGSDPAAAAALQQITAPAPLQGVQMHEVAFVAPDLDHVADVFAQPVSMLHARYADLSEAEGWLAPTTELGSYVTRISFVADEMVGPSHTRFTEGVPLLATGS